MGLAETASPFSYPPPLQQQFFYIFTAYDHGQYQGIRLPQEDRHGKRDRHNQRQPLQQRRRIRILEVQCFRDRREGAPAVVGIDAEHQARILLAGSR